jgi:hypothetical protein
MRRWTSGAALTLLLSASTMAGCAEIPTIANPTDLPADALSLQYVLDQGCFPFILGEKSEFAAMRGVGLTRVTAWTLVGSNDRRWIGRYPGISAVHAAPGSCYIHVIGADAAAYRAAVISVLRRRLDADPEADAKPGRYVAWRPGEITACRRGVRYAYYADPPHGVSGAAYDVELHADHAC